MPTPLNIAVKIANELVEQAEALRTIKQEMSKLEPAYSRFRELVEKAETLKACIEEAAATLGPDEFRLDATMDLARKNISLSLSVDRLRAKLPLWRAMARIVKHAPWIQVVDLQETLDELGIAVSRAAIESALMVHKKIFRIRRIDRAKFVALKD
jgi:hypothetical protein